MAVAIPGLSISIIRGSTSVQSGQPVLISGRFTAFGIGVPALIAVFLEGPDYNPESILFVTSSSPISGDYNVQVTAPKDGTYKVYAQAYPVPPLPTAPLFTGGLPPLPAIAESEAPPLVIGSPSVGGVSAQLPGGSQFLAAPSQTPIELMVSVGAPSVSVITGGGLGAAGAYLPYIPPTPPTPTVPTIPTLPAAAAKNAVIDDLRMFPDTITPGQAGTGFASWRNLGSATATFNVSFTLVSPTGITYGPLQTLGSLRAFPASVQTTPIQLNTTGLPTGRYDVTAEIRDSDTGSLIATRTFTSRLNIVSVEVPAVPTLPTIPTVPTLPTLPVQTLPSLLTANMVGLPIFNLPSQLTIGETWSGNVQVPTVIPPAPSGYQQLTAGMPGLPSYQFRADLSLEDPDGLLIPVASNSPSLQLGQPLNLPVNFNTSNRKEGRYNVWLKITGSLGTSLFNNIIGRLYLLALPGMLPPVPTLPTLPTAGMFKAPALSLPSSVTLGDIWPGSITIPTIWPSGLPTPPSLPDFPVSVVGILQAPTGEGFPLGYNSLSFVPGQPISIPINFDTSNLPGAGNYSLLLRIVDMKANTLFSQIIGSLRVLAALIPPTLPQAPTLPTAGMFKLPVIALPSSVTLGDIWPGSITIPTIWPSGLPTPPSLPAFPVTVVGILQAPTGEGFPLGYNSLSFVPGQPISIPINFDTSNLPGAGDYSLLLRIVDMKANTLFSQIIGRLQVLAALRPPTLPPAPTLPTAGMFKAPSVNLPRSVTLGDIWSGSITIPTISHLDLASLGAIWSGAISPPSLPSYPISVVGTLQSPTGKGFPVITQSPSFSPGQDISLPINFNTSNLPGAGNYSLLLRIVDMAGNALFSQSIGSLQVLAAALVPPIPPVPLPAAPAAQYTIKSAFDPYNAGTGSMYPSKAAYNYGDVIHIEVRSAQPGYWAFNYWDENGVWLDSNPTIDYLVTKNATLTAHFRRV